jgi:hypothetical protein
MFWTHAMVLLGDKAQVDARSVHLEIVLILMQGRSTICVERTTGLKIVFDTTDRTPR